MAIHTPPASRIVRNTSTSAEMPTSSAISNTALKSLLDDFFSRRRLRLFVSWWIAAHDVDEFVDEGDEKNQQAAAVPELRNPERHRQYALRHRSEEHTSELQSRRQLVCRILLEH